MKNFKYIIVGALSLLMLAGCQPPVDPGQDPGQKTVYGEKVDDWSLNMADLQEDDFFSSKNMATQSVGMNATMSAGAPMMEADKAMGFSTGGAKDINNFRENIENDYLPLFTDLTYEGLFYNYFFDIGSEREACSELFCPTYSIATSRDPFSLEKEYYMTVGLDSGMTEQDFERKNLNLVVVLDISGSMGSPFDSYYYDNERDYEPSKSKMEIANESIVAMLDHLNPEDRLGVVLFDDGAYVAKPMNLVGETDLDAIKDHILEISDRGGTNMEAGYRQGTELLKEYMDADPAKYENRIIFLTDAQPNRGALDDESLIGMTQNNSEKNINTTFIGIGVDFNTELIEMITKVRGANYYAVHSSKEFSERMDDEFDFMVTPLVYNLQLNLESDGYKIDKVFGSPEADEATGELMKVNTLFPSKSVDGEVKGGIVLVKLSKTGTADDIQLTASFEDREGKKSNVTKKIKFDTDEIESFENTGIRKGILLTRYANLVKNWIVDERANYPEDPRRPIPYQPRICDPVILQIDIPQDRPQCGIILPPIDYKLGKWERQSLDLVVSKEYQELFESFATYYVDEMEAIGDDSLQQELDVLDKLAGN